MLQFQKAAEQPISLPMSSNDLEAQRAVVLSFRIQVGFFCDFQSNWYSLRIQELHQLLTYGGMSKSGNKPTLQVSLQSNLCHYLLCIQKRALEMVENSRDPNMSTKIQELSRQVTFTSLTIQVRSAISFSEHDLHRCLILLVHFKTGIACPPSLNRWYIYWYYFCIIVDVLWIIII